MGASCIFGFATIFSLFTNVIDFNSRGDIPNTV
jgi:hypothetical protein